MRGQISFPAIAAAIVLVLLVAKRKENSFCRCKPSESCWPNSAEWEAFNRSIDQTLVKVRPVGVPCHEPYFDKNACHEAMRRSPDSGWRVSHPGISITVSTAISMKMLTTIVL